MGAKITPRILPFDDEAQETPAKKVDDEMEELADNFENADLNEKEPAQEAIPVPDEQVSEAPDEQVSVAQTVPRKYRGRRSSETVKSNADLYESDPRILDCLLEFLGDELKPDT